jgi:NADH-quinone oxidoreductase subunit J
MEDILFYVFAAITLASAAVVVFSKNVMHSAFSLLFTLFGIAAFYVLLSADFLAVSQIMIYIGGILVLIIFGVMLTSRITGVEFKSGLSGKVQTTISLALAAIVAVTLSIVYSTSEWFTKEITTEQIASSNSLKGLGVELMTDYLVAFEVASVLLTIALVGAALIARRKN